MTWVSDTNHIPQQMTTPSPSVRHRPSTQQLMLSPELTPLPADCWRFLEKYYSFTQCWLPICEKLDILKLSYSYPEQGLALAHDMPDSGHHAEMWSILAVGCIQARSDTTESQENHNIVTPRKLYGISRRLIPDEVGSFDLNHIKALLNLAVFNIGRSFLSTAWLLVGTASRIFLTLNKSLKADSPRRSNVLASCFLLDSILSLHFRRQPYLDKADLAWAGSIEEDGMEEWQPWDGETNLGTISQARMPTLALSSFNHLLELVDILVSSTQQSTARNFLHEMIGRLEIWKSSLPPKLDYIRSDCTSTPLTPPAVLLQLTYFTTAFALVPSQAWLQRILDFFDVLRAQLGLARLPAIVVCLLQSVKRCSNSLTLDQATGMRLHKLLADFHQSCAITSNEGFHDPQNMSTGLVGASPNVVQMRHPDLIQTSPQSFSGQIGESLSARYQPPTGSSSLLDDLLPDMNSTRQQSLTTHPFDLATDVSTLHPATFEPEDPYNAFVSGDLENFFDELASLHGAKKLQNQPQFMQNLGFSSEANMADLLAAEPGRFMPLPMSSLGQGSNNEPSNFPLNTFYDVG